MWEVGNFWTERLNPAPMATIHAMVHEIHVLLVDNDAETLIHTANQLQLCQYRVSYADVAHAAISMLVSPEKAKFDVVMANINSLDPNGYKLLQHALNMCIPVVWMSDDDNTSMAMRALENGAFICIKKPPPMEFLKCVWQHVIREKARMLREREMLVIATNNRGVAPVRGVEFRDINPNPSPNPNPNFMGKNKGRFMANSRGRHNEYEEEYESDHNTMSQNGGTGVRRKLCTEWTQDLHAKFMAAVGQLGEGRCFPKEILEMMNEPGLTRMQVASHLQKCRNDNWRSPEERKPITSSSHHVVHNSLAPNAIRTPPSKPRKFGSMPLATKPSSSSRKIHVKTQEPRWETPTPNNGGVKIGQDATNEYFNFPDMDISLMHHDFSSRHPQPDPQQGYQLHPNSGEGSGKTKSH